MTLSNLPKYALDALRDRLWERIAYSCGPTLTGNPQHWWRIRAVFNRVTLETNRRLGERMNWL